MADQVFVYNGPPGTPPPYGSPFTVLEGWADWLKKAWISALVANGYGHPLIAWIPTYETGSVSWPGNDGKVQTLPLSQFFLPTRETADILAARFGVQGHSLIVLEIPFFNSIQRFLQFPNSKILDASQLAQYFTNNPEDHYPGIALSLCQLQILKVWP